MYVECSSEWSTYAGNKRGVNQGLDDNDGRRLAGVEAWEAMTWVQQHDYLEKKADLLVLVYLRKEDAITEEFLLQRVAEVKAR